MRSANGTPLMKWCASGLLVLALSPFTAPFQTVHIGRLLNGSGHDETALVTPLTEVYTSIADDDDDPGSLIAPARDAIEARTAIRICCPHVRRQPRCHL